ncbi:DUF397 domain-containing protein [Streptomyces lutosisoli]|uniref:DUF397 domain-containing protein n=1 Tax=Streptomyces lutosisoli TaxID=2665721 RepID=A0ABW2VMB0_9ACTN
MPQLTWQKSSFSGGGNGECVELAAATAGHIRLRESDEPHAIATTTPHTLAGLLGALKAGRIARP